jgi:hypothetical protein
LHNKEKLEQNKRVRIMEEVNLDDIENNDSLSSCVVEYTNNLESPKRKNLLKTSNTPNFVTPAESPEISDKENKPI